MFIIRRAKIDDVSTLLKLARTVHFINLPPDKEIIDEKVSWSRNCFMLAAESGTHARKPKKGAGDKSAAGSSSGSPKGPPAGKNIANGVLSAGLRSVTGRAPLFMFVMEELESQGVVGTCQIISKMGGPGFPNVSLQLSYKDLFSQSLQMGVRHTVAQIHLDESSPTEIGGLILQHSLRGHKMRLGRFLSLVRFHFMGLHRQMFSDHVLAEMMGPITADGFNPFWDHCTRCFINLTYEQADKFCQQSKEFLLTLFPREPLYLTLLAPEARSVVGEVGPETVPARRMLENMGFKYHQRIDPFDGGPHLEAKTDEIEPVKNTDRSKLAEPAHMDDASSLTRHGMVSVLPEDGEFRAVETQYDLDRSGRLIIPEAAMQALQASPGAEAGFTPTSLPAGRAAPLRENLASSGGNGASRSKGGKKAKR